jgi:hypothetical protein
MTRRVTTTPHAEKMITLGLSGGYHEAVLLTSDEHRALEKVYGFTRERECEFVAAGNFRNLMRHASHDGLRVIAYMARFLEPGEDPVRFIGQLLMDAGFDVPNDVEWFMNNYTPEEGGHDE